MKRKKEICCRCPKSFGFIMDLNGTQINTVFCLLEGDNTDTELEERNVPDNCPYILEYTVNQDIKKGNKQ